MSIESLSLALRFLGPEFCVVATILFASLWNLFFPKSKGFTPVFSLVGLGGAFLLFILQFHILKTGMPTVALFDGLYTVDMLTVLFGLIAVTVGFVVVLMTTGYEHRFGRNRGEFYAILLTAILAVMLLAGTTDLIMLFVGLETLTICCVLLAGFEKKNLKSSEASLKYLLSTAAVTATLLYGLSFIYGLTGSTSYSLIQEKLALLSPSTSLIKVFMLVLVLSAVGFKLAAVPFHMWAPDVYEGAPTPVTAFLSIGSKAGGLVVALRLLLVVFGNSAPDWTAVVSILAILSMIAGNLIALAQTSFKRMLAYSSIAHVGYILIGLVTNSEAGLSAMTFYIVVYGAMNLGAFAGAIIFSELTGSDNIDDFSGLIRKRPFLALGMSVCLLNLAGLPLPPAGFFAKLFVFATGMQMAPVRTFQVGWLLVGVALITSIPAIYYYTRVVIKMIAREQSPVVAALPGATDRATSLKTGPALALVACVMAIFATSTQAVDPVMYWSRIAIAPVAPVPERTIPLGALPFNWK